jgi:hypothetical protein
VDNVIASIVDAPEQQNKMSRVDDISVTYAHMAGFDINSGIPGSYEYSECSRCMVASIINDRDNRQLRGFQQVWILFATPVFAAHWHFSFREPDECVPNNDLY